jgi:hypothetical protein
VIKKLTKKQKAAQEVAFNAGVVEIGTRLGGVSQGKEWLPNYYEITTRAGYLSIATYGNWVACKFNDPDAAKAVVGTSGLNPFSGKWNQNYFDVPVKDALEDFERVLRRILPPEVDRLAPVRVLAS